MQHTEDYSEKARQFREDGVVVLRGVIEQKWLVELCEAEKELRKQFSSDNEEFLTLLDLWQKNDRIDNFVRNSGIAEVAAQVLCSKEIRLYHDIVISKKQINDIPTPWHQDAATWEAVGNQLCGIWFSLDSVKESSGALRLVKGSHRGPIYSHPAQLTGGKDFIADNDKAIPDIEANPELHPVICHDLEPGDALVFHPGMLHSALGGKGTAKRVSYAFRFLGDDVRWQPCSTSIHSSGEAMKFKPGDKFRGGLFLLLWPAL